MIRDYFNQQIKRLQSVYGEKSYPNERQQAIWNKVNHIPEGAFGDLVEKLIANSRTAPMLKELLEGGHPQPDYSEASRMSPVEILEDSLRAGKSNLSPTAYERVQARVRLLGDYSSRKITKVHFWEGCEFYDEQMRRDEKTPVLK